MAHAKVEIPPAVNFSSDLQNQIPTCFIISLLLLCIRGLSFLKSTTAGHKAGIMCPSQDSLHCISILKCTSMSGGAFLKWKTLSDHLTFVQYFCQCAFVVQDRDSAG